MIDACDAIQTFKLSIQNTKQDLLNILTLLSHNQHSNDTKKIAEQIKRYKYIKFMQ